MALAGDCHPLQGFHHAFVSPSSTMQFPLLPHGMVRDGKGEEMVMEQQREMAMVEQSRAGRKRRRALAGSMADNHQHLQQNRKSSPLQTQTQSETHLQHLDLGVDLNQSLQQLAMAPAALRLHTGNNNNVVNVCTGLRLAFVDDEQRSTVTSSRPADHHRYAATLPPAPTHSAAIALTDELSAQLSKHHDELDHLLRTQAEQLRQAMEEKAQRHTRALLTAIESELSKRITAKEAELEQALKKNIELQETVKQVSMESQLWQSKARSNETMVAILRSNLQQAVMVQQQQSREQQSRLMEGCGESSEADDAASAYIDQKSQSRASMKMMMVMKKNSAAGASSAPPTSAQINPLSTSSSSSSLAMAMRACRLCRVKEASVVLLPCLHLCLCSSCKDRPPHRCPICSTVKSASVEVFLT